MSEHSFKPVRMGVVGVGRFGCLHALTLAGLAEAELVAIVDTDEDAIRGVQKELPSASGWNSLEDALQGVNAEAWVVATRPSTHITLSSMILETDAYVLIEKPLAPSLEVARELSPVAKASSKKVMLGHTMLFAAEIRQIMQELDQRSPLLYFHAFRHRPASLWHPERATPLRELMVHDLYLAYAMTKGLEPIAFSARHHPREGGGYDLSLADLEWENGVWGSFTASFITPEGMGHEGYDRLEVFGKDWSARLDLVPQPLTVWTDRAQWPLGLNIYADPEAPMGWLAEELRHFCRVVRGQAQVPLGASYEDALRIMEWLEKLEAG